MLSDLHLPNMGGLALLDKLQKRPNPPSFVAITAWDTDHNMLKVLTRGGAGYIVKSSHPQEISYAIRHVVNGGTFVSPQTMKRLVRYLPKDVHTRAPIDRNDTAASIVPSLTNIEATVLDHLCHGKSNAEIAVMTNYSESTVKKQVSRLISRFGVTSRLSLVVKVLRARCASRGDA